MSFIGNKPHFFSNLKTIFDKHDTAIIFNTWNFVTLPSDCKIYLQIERVQIKLPISKKTKEKEKPIEKRIHESGSFPRRNPTILNNQQSEVLEERRKQLSREMEERLTILPRWKILRC